MFLRGIARLELQWGIQMKIAKIRKLVKITRFYQRDNRNDFQFLSRVF